MTHPFGLLRQRNIILQYYVEHSMFIIGQIKCSWLLPHRQAICFSSLIWLSRNKSVKKSRFSRIVKNSREFSLLDLDLEAFWFHFSLLEKEWKHFDFTLHFSKKSESIFFSLCTSRKRVKAFYFHFSLLELQKPTLAGPWLLYWPFLTPGKSVFLFVRVTTNFLVRFLGVLLCKS